MNQSTLIIFLLSATISSIAQTTRYTIEDVDPRNVTYKTYGGDSLDRAMSILPLDSKSDLVIGLNFDSGSGDPTISKVLKKDLSV